MALSNDVKKALQTLRKDLDSDASHARWLLDELERHLGLKSDAPAAPVAAPVAPPAEPVPAEGPVAPPVVEDGAPETEIAGPSRRDW